MKIFYIICSGVSAAAIVVITGAGVAITALPTNAGVQSRIVNGSDGPVVSDARGKVTARTATFGNTTTIYDADGRRLGTITETQMRR